MNKLLAPASTSAPRLRIAFVSSCAAPWGGCEELWAGTALLLARAGHTVRAFKTNVAAQQPHLVALRAAGCPVTELNPATSLLKRIVNRLQPYRSPRRVNQQILRKHLCRLQPHFVLISQGANYDGLLLADVCRHLGLPYVLLAQAANPYSVPHYQERTLMQAVYRAARHSFFVAQHNLNITELQLGMRLPEATIVRNPYNVAFAGELPWPAPDGLRLACVARLLLEAKGQDILLQVLAQPKWQQRAVHLTLYGSGPDEAAIRGMIELLGLHDQVKLGGHVADITQVWRTHHALILPSRCEGLPLALVEAMLSGRPVIATDAGGIAELLADNETGFLAIGLTVPTLDEALERAWLARAYWPELGAEAARRARALVPADTPTVFAERLLALTVQGSVAAPSLGLAH